MLRLRFSLTVSAVPLPLSAKFGDSTETPPEIVAVPLVPASSKMWLSALNKARCETRLGSEFGDLEAADDLVERAGIGGVSRLVDGDQTAARRDRRDMRDLRLQGRKAARHIGGGVGDAQLIGRGVLVGEF